MKNAADFNAAEVAPTSGTGGMCDGIGALSMTPDSAVEYIDSRWVTLQEKCQYKISIEERYIFGDSQLDWSDGLTDPIARDGFVDGLPNSRRTVFIWNLWGFLALFWWLSKSIAFLKIVELDC
jgi:hypothetical protein